MMFVKGFVIMIGCSEIFRYFNLEVMLEIFEFLKNSFNFFLVEIYVGFFFFKE